jgi:hypothetical protein
LKNLRRALVAIGAGIGLTLGPFLLPMSWNNATRFFQWPMLLVDRPHSNWLPLNAGNRLIVLFLVNVTGWAISLVVFWMVGTTVVLKSKVVARD